MIKKMLKFVLVFLILFGIFLFALVNSNTIIGRDLRFGDANVNHYKVFPYNSIIASESYFQFEKNYSEELVKDTFRDIQYGNNKKIGDLDLFLEKTKTSSFIVIKDDKILFEKYYNDYDRDSIVTSFSVAKSFTSALIGIAIDEGYINSVYDPITDYIPELKERDERFSQIRILDLLHMSSGIKYDSKVDDRNTYYAADLRKLAIEKTQIGYNPGTKFEYNNYHPLLLGIILERATNKPVSLYLQEKIWKPIGMEYNGSWSTDEYNFEKMESGINCRAIDFAKFGRLYLQNGNWDGKQIISNEWVKMSTEPYFPDTQGYYPDVSLFRDHSVYYSLMWWGVKKDGTGYDYFALGNFGQFIYVSPDKNLIIVRNGMSYGEGMENDDIDWWPIIFYEFANRL